MKHRLGIVGGGQLGRMLALAAKPLGFRVTVIDPTPQSPAGQVADEQIVADYEDEAAIRELGGKVDFLTFEIELANAAVLEELAAAGVAVNPSARSLGIIRDKLAQKQFLSERGLPVAAFEQVRDRADIMKATERFGWPVVLKARVGGYDGRGNAVIRRPDEIDGAMAKLAGRDLYVEQWVPFVKELAVVSARSFDGTIATYPVVETEHKNNICHIVKVPAAIPETVRAAAESLGASVMRELGGAGVYGIEMFLTAEGRVLVNEIAPRVHNSGHLTIEANRTSQFEQHVRAVSGLPLGSTELMVPAAAMINILGDRAGDASVEGLADALAEPGVAVHLYGKVQTRPERKMGHITAVAGTVDEALRKVRAARDHITI